MCRGGRSWEGGSAKQGCPSVWTGLSLTDLGDSQCTVIALGLRVLLLTVFSLALGFLSPEALKAPALPPVARSKLHTHWSNLLLMEVTKAPKMDFFFHTCPLLINSDCAFATTEMGTSKSGLEFAASGTLFLLTSQLLTVAVCCLLCSELGYRSSTPCGKAFISISNCSFCCSPNT